MPATTYTWSNAAGGDWTVPANWSQSSYPNSSTATAIVGLAGSYTVSLAGTDPAITVGTLSITNQSATVSISTAGSVDAVTGILANAGTLKIINGATLAVTGNLLNTGGLLLDGDAYSAEGGSAITVAGTLTNTDYINIGPPSGNLTANDTLSVGALAGAGAVGLYGSSHQATFLIGAAAPGTLAFDLALYGDSLLQYGLGQIGTVASNVTLLLDGPNAFVADAGTITSNSALTGLTENDGTLKVINGASLGVTGNLLNTGGLLLDGDAYSAEGGSTITVAGTLTNNDYINVGPPSGNLTANDTLSVGALAGAGAVGLYGGTHQATFLIGAAAPGTLGFNLSLYGDALLQYGHGQIGTVASNVTLLLDGPNAFIADAGTITANSALTGLTENDGTLKVINGASLAVAGNLLNTGGLLLDGDAYSAEGASTLTVAGTLTNIGNIAIGPGSGNLTANDTLSVAAFADTGAVGLNGGTHQATFLIGAAAPGTLGFNLSLYGDSLLQYGHGQIGTVASNVTLLLDGPNAFIADAGTITANSALTGLTENDGTLRVINGASLTVAGNLLNTGGLLLDGDPYSAEGGSTIIVAGTLTNTDYISIGPGSGNLTANDTLSVAAFADTGAVGLNGGAHQATFLIGAAAPGTLAFNLSLYSDALLQYGHGQIGTVASNVTLLLDGPNAFVADAGTITSNSALTGLTENDGTLKVINGGSLTVAGNLLNTGGLLLDGDPYSAEGGSTIIVAGTLTNTDYIYVGPGSGNLTANDTLTVGALVNTGHVDLSAGTNRAVLLVSGGVSNSNQIDLSGGATLSATGSFTQSGGATQVDGRLATSGGTLTGGSLYGTGTIAGALNIDAGTVYGGDQASQPGTLTVTGTYDQTGTGVLIADLAGTAPGQTSELAVTGAAILGGTLDVNPVNGLVLANGNIFNVLTFAPGQLTGGFSTLEYGAQTSSGAINIGNGLFLAALYNDAAGNVEIEVTNTLTAITWTNPGSGTWTNPANWNPNQIPGAGDAAVIPNLPTSATVSLNGSDSLSSLNFQGGGALSIASGSTLTVTTGVKLPGTITGGGVLEIQNQLTNTASISIQNGTLQLDAGVPTGGTLATAANGTILLPNGATVAQIEALEPTNQGTIALNGTFSDTGQTLQVTHGTVEFQNVLNNTGSIVVNAATLKLDSGLTGNEQITLLNGGVLDVNGSTLLLEIGAGNTFINGGTLEATGPGVLQIDGGTLTNSNAAVFANGGIINLTGGLLVAGGTLASANGGVIQSTSGNSVTLDPTGTTLLNTGAYTVDGNSTTVLVGTVSNTGVILDNGSLIIGDAAGDGAALTNQAGGLIDLAQNNVDITQAAAGTNTFTNAGTLEQTGGNNNYVEMPLVNTGLVESEGGFLELQGGVLGGTIANQGGNLALIGAYTAAVNATDTVTFNNATLGWSTDGDAVLSGPGTLLSNGNVGVYQYYGNTELQLTDGITWENAGTVNQNGALLFGNGTLDSATIVNLTGGLYELTSGNAQLAANTPGNYKFVNAGTLEQIGGGNNTVSETLTNSGLITANNGNFYLSGPVSNSGTLQSNGGFLELQGGTLGGTIQDLGGNVGLIGTYTVAAGMTDTVTFAGATLGWNGDGIAVLAGPGTLVSNGYVHVYHYYGNTQLQLIDGITFKNAGTVYQDGAVLLGSGSLDTATIVNLAGATYDLTTGDSQLNANGAGTYSFINAGTFEMTGGGSDYLYATLTNSGLVSANNGNLYLEDPVSNSGTLQSNGGFLEVRGGTLGGTIQDLAGNVGLVGTYTVAASTTDTVTFAGATLGSNSDGDAILAGPGTLLSNGYVHVYHYYGYTQLQLIDGLTWNNAGTVYQDGAILLGSGSLDTATIINQAGAIYDLTTGDSQISTSGTAGYSFVNDGLLEMTGGGTDTIAAAVANAGLISADNGNLILAGPITNSGTIETEGGSVQINGGVLGGTIDGLNGNAILEGTYTSAAGATITVTFSGADLGSGSSPIAILAGPGTLLSLGSVNISQYYGYTQVELTGGITWDNNGTVNDYGAVQFGAVAGDSATIVNQAGATFDLTSGNAGLVIGAAGTYSFVNLGLLEMTAGGSNTIYVPLTNSGLVSADNGTLVLAGPISNSGTIETAGGAIQFSTGGVLGGSILGGSITLWGTYVSAANTTDAVTFSGATFGDDGSIAVLDGPGTLVTSGAVSINSYYAYTQMALTGGITWDNAGVVSANGAFQFGNAAVDSATLNNLAGAVIDLISGNSQIYVSGTGAYNFFNAGTLEMTGGGTDTIQVPVTNTGLVAADNGTLILDAPIAESGTIEATGGAIQIAGGVFGGAILGSNVLLYGTFVSAANTTDTVTFSGAVFGEPGSIAVLDGPGTLATSGAFSVNSYYGYTQLSLTGGITWDNAGILTVNGGLQFGNAAGDSATLVNQSGGVIDLTSGNANILTGGSGSYSLVNAGLLEQTSGSSAIDVAVDDTATGTITATGAIAFNAGGTISGAVNGASGIGFDGGNVTVTAGGDITAASVAINAGTLTMLGGTIASAALSIASGIEVTGYGAIGDLSNAGTIDAAGGLLTVNGNITGAGSLQIETGATLELTGSTSQNVTFDGIDATLKLDSPSSFTGALDQFGAGDTIALAGVTLSAVSLVGNQLIGTLAAGGTIAFSAPNISSGLKLTLGTLAAGGSTISLLPSPVSAVPLITTVLGANNSITLPEVHVGAPTDQEILSIANTATAPADGLNVSIGAITGNAAATGSISSLAPGGTSTLIAVGVNDSSGGAESGTVGLSFQSNGSVSGVVANLGTLTLNVSGAVYRYAAPVVTAPSGVILHVGQGGGTVTEALTVANTAQADGYSEGLDAVATGVVSGNLTATSGRTGDIAAGNSSTALGVTISTAVAGTVSGTVGVALTSDGTGIDTLGTTAIGTPLSSYSAVANFATTSNPNGAWSYLASGALLTTAATGSNYARWSNNQSIPTSVSVTENTTSTTQTYSNTIILPPSYLNLDPESLANVAVAFTAPTAGVYTFTGGFLGTDTGENAHTVAVVVNGGTVESGTIASYGQTLAIGLTETLAAGGIVDFVSNTGGSYNNLSTGLSLTATTASGQVVPVSVTIDNYATAAVEQTSGPGTLSVSGTTYTLNLGAVAAGPGQIVDDLAVANIAAGPADWLSGSLTATGSAAFSDGGLVNFANLSAGGTTAVVIDLSTANAGIFTQTITLAATDSNAAGFTEALPGETVVVTGTVLSTTQLAQPVINEPSPIVLANVHVAPLVENDQTLLSISNFGSATLSAALTSSSGNAYGSGAFSGLADGQTNTTGIVAGLNNTTAGIKSGTVTLSFGSGSPPPVPLPSQTVTLTGTVYREAAPAVTGPANVYVHVGDGGGSETAALTVANTAPADGFSEALDAAALSIVSGALTSVSGTITSIAAGGSNTTALKLGFSTATAATINATVAVSETSDGNGIDGLGLSNIGTVDVPVTVTVDNYATAAIEQTAGPGTLSNTGSLYTLNLGTLVSSAGSVIADVGLFNIAPGPADSLSGSLIASGATAFANTGLGSVGTLAAGSGAQVQVVLSTATTGIYSETITFAGTDSNPSGFSASVGGETLVVTGTVLGAASPHLNTASPISFGAVRQGTTVQQALSVSNTAAAGGASLDVGISATSGAGTGTGSVTALAPGATDSTDLLAGLNTGTVGVQSGSVTLAYSAITGSGTTPDGGATVAVSGTVYREAAALLTGPALTYLHSGGTITEHLTVQNTDPSTYSENLIAGVVGVTGALSSGSGTVTLAPTVSNATTLAVVINAGTTAGTFTGNALVDEKTSGTGIDGLGTLDIGTVDVAVTYLVDNYATAELAQTGGEGLMTPTGSAAVYTLNLGSTEQGAAALTASLEALNAAQGPAADLLSGTFTVSGATEYSNTGLTSFSGITYGTADTAPDVVLNTGTVGTFSETIVLAGTGSNPSGYSGILSKETLNVIGTIVAQPPPAPPPLPTAIAWGDVHITTFDGLYYNFQAEGEFVLAQSTITGDTFQVQARMLPYTANSTVSVITMLAAQVGADRITFALGRTDPVYINGAGVQFGAVGETMSLGSGGSVTETSVGSYQVTWTTGEVMDVTIPGSTYINMNLTLAAADGPGSIKGLLGSDTGQANDFQLANGTVISQANLTSSELYGEYANAWRVTGTSSLMDYSAGQTTSTFTDTNFPSDAVNVGSLPAAITAVADQEAIAAGITNPNLQAAAVIDLLVTGNPNAALADASITQTGGVTDAAIISGPPPAVPALGVSAASSHVIETAGGTTAVTFTAYLTSPAGTDTVIDYAVTAPDATYLPASAFGGTLPSGYVTIAAGQTTANFTITLPTAVLGSQPFSNLQVTITSTNGDPVFGPTAQTEIDNFTPVAGNPAIPQLSLASGSAIFAGSAGHYTLNLGTLVAGEATLQDRLQIGNEALAPSDFLTGSLTATSSNGFNTYGTGTVTPLSAGTTYQSLLIQTNSGTVGLHTETIVFAPVDDNVTGYSTILPSQTVTVTDTVLSPAAGTLLTAGPLNLGTFYQGAVVASPLDIKNAATAGSAGLDVAGSVASGAATVGGSITGLAPGASSLSGVSVGISTAAPGIQTGTVTLTYASDAGSGNTSSDGSTQIAVIGTVYGPATAFLSAAPIYVHKGDDGGTATTTITVSNTAPNTIYTEALDAQVVGFGPYVTAASGSAVVAPGGSNTTALTASLSTGTLGTWSGFVEVATQSNGTGIDSHGVTTLGTVYVPVTINVDQYAVAAFEQISGNGTLTPTGVASQYVLNLGTVAQYATPLGANLGVLNDVLGAADLLGGAFMIVGAPEFVNSGFTPFGSGTAVGGLAAQQTDTSPVVVLSTNTAGVFTETVTLTPADYNASGYSAVQAPETVTITGTVVAAPLPVPVAKIGNSWGDVHITTFDGLYYNFQAEGEFVLAESTVTGDSFQVQARMQPLGSSSVTLNTEIAAQIGTDRVTFQAGRTDVVWIDGVASTLSSTNQVVTLAGGTLEQQSANSYELIWNTGEQLQVTDEGSYFNVNVSLPSSDASKVQGLLGTDNGNPANDLTLPIANGGSILGTSVTYAELYGQYANDWRVTAATSLMDYGPGQNTASFTNTNFPYNQIALGNIPPSALAAAAAAVAAAGITDPNLIQAAEEDYLLTGNPNALAGSENVQQQEGTAVASGTTLTAAPVPVAALGVFANQASVAEPTGTTTKAVGFTVSLTSAEANATTIDYTVVDPGPGYLSAAQFGGILPSGTVTIAAGQTSAVFTVALPANVLGTAADDDLEVLINATGGEQVFAPLALTEILATGPTEGNPAAPLVEQLSGVGTLSASSATAYMLNLGTVTEYSNPLLAGLGVLNNGIVPADLLSGTFVVNGSTQFVNSGLAPFSPIAAGAADVAPETELLTNQVGTFTETITLSPTDSNLTGFSTALAPVTVEVTGTVVAPPPPPPPQVPLATAWGDVHLTTFDGLYYNFQAAGEFILTQSTVAGDTFQVQARLQPYGTGSTVSVQTMVGAEVGKDDVTFANRTNQVWLDGAAYTFGGSGVMTLAGGTVTLISPGDYRVNWNTGESMTVAVSGSYINDTISLTTADAGNVQGLLGPDSGNPANDLRLANGTVIPQPITSAELYGAYANAWRVASDATSLLNYGTNQTTATFTDTSFPSDVLQLNQLPASVVAAAELIAEQAGITDPNLLQAAAIDLLVTGNPGAVFASANVQQQGVTLTGAGVGSAVPLPEVGIAANNPTAIEPTTGTLAVGYTVYLTAAEAQATTITYAVTDPGAGYLGLSGVVGGTGSGSVHIAAGQTSAQITIDVLANALGSQPQSNLQVTVTPTGGQGIIGATAQTEIVNPVPTAGNPAIALLEQLSGNGALTGSGTSYNLNLGTTVQNASPLYANIGIENAATVPADNLSGLFTITHYSNFLNTGFASFSGVAPGAADTAPVIALNTGTIGTFTETVVLDPSDSNLSGYSTLQSNVTLTVTGTIAAPPPPPPPPVPTATAFGDVHLTTFDGLYYNFQAVGEFTLAKSTRAGDSYDVQVRTGQYNGSSVSVIDQVAAALGNQSVTFGINRPNEVYLNGTAQAMGVGSALTVNGDTVQELSASDYLVTWSTGESMTVTGGGTYLNVSTSLSSTDGSGSVQGLLGENEGTTKDFQLANGTVLTQPITTTNLYGEFANAWRLTQSTSLLNYAVGQTTATFTDLAFPSDALTLASLPSALQAQGLQAAIQAGITDPNLQAAAALDVIVTGDPNIVVGGQNAQQQGITTTAANVTAATVTPAVGVSADSAALVEPATGNLSVGFEVYLTAAETTATTVNYTVTAPGAGYLGASAFAGDILPSGSVTIAAGQTSASFSVAVSAAALGTLPSSALQVNIAPAAANMPVFAPDAQTTIINNTIEPGTAAAPSIVLLGGAGTLTEIGNAYTLALGAVALNAKIESLSLAIENTVTTGGNALAGSLAASSTPGFTVSGAGPLPVIAAGAQYEDLHVAVNTGTATASTETITFTPLSQNASGYSGTLSPVTLTITDAVVQQSFVLTLAPTTITGGIGGDTFFATNDVLYARDTITPGGANNTLLLQGAGTFNLAAPFALSNIQTVDVQDATASQSQVIDLRAGLDLTLNVQDPAVIEVFGAANNDIINLGAGTAIVTPGNGETVNVGSGPVTFLETAATIGATIVGGSGSSIMRVQNGGTVTMGSNISGVSVVYLDNSASYAFTANAIAGLKVEAGTGNDTITVGAASQQVFGSTGTLTVLATAANSGAAVYGTGVSGSSATLEITNSGTVTLNSGDKNLTVQLAAGDTLAVPYTTSVVVQGGGGSDALIATNAYLHTGQTIAPGGTSNTLLLRGAGTFNLTAPTVISNIQTVDVQNCTASQSQYIDLRSGLNLTLNVQDTAFISLLGAANNDIINLGAGVASVTPGDGETVNGGSGAVTFLETAATIGAAIVGGSGSNIMKVQNGGTVTMGSNITGVPLVYLDNSASYDFTANATAGLKVEAGTGNDTIAVGAASQQIFGSTGTLTVLATTANSGAAVYGASTSSRTTLELTNSGTVSLNSGDKNLTVQLAAGDTLAVPYSTSIAVQGGGGGDTLIAVDSYLRTGQTIAPGGGANTMLLQGAGTFNLAGPTTLSNIQTVDAQGATVGQSQVIDLRAGLNLTLNVQDSANITLVGAANNDIINLGSGSATVTLGGAGETVNGGTGNATFYVTAATISAAIAAGSGTNVMRVQSGGTVTMGSNITGVPVVYLDNSASYNFTANATAGLKVLAGTGTDTIAVGAASQQVVGSSGTLTVRATSAEAGIAVASGSGPTTLEITNGGNATLNAGETNLTVKLDASTNLGLSGLAFITAIGAASGGDTITAGGANQTLESTGGNDTLTGSSRFGDTFLGTSIGLAGDRINGFGGSDVIDITDISSSTVQPLAFNSATDQLKVTDGTHSVTLTFSGTYTASSFSAPTSDGHTGTLIKFV